MDHRVEVFIMKKLGHAVLVSTVHFDEVETDFFCQTFNPCRLELWVVVRVEVVDPHDVIASVEE